jgi:hypothetical protein
MNRMRCKQSEFFCPNIGARDIANQRITSALFLRSLAELRHLGLVRGTRKKADHVMKISWKGI